MCTCVRGAAACVLVVGVVAASMGCSTVRETQPPRTATEQLILSYAVKQAIDAMPVDGLADRRVYVDGQFVDRVDAAYVEGEVRAKVLAGGGLLVESRLGAEVVVEIRSPGVGINRVSRVLGVPALSVPSPAGVVDTPEFALIKNEKQRGLAGVGVSAYEAESGRMLFVYEPTIGQTVYSDWSILGIPISRKRENLPDALHGSE